MSVPDLSNQLYVNVFQPPIPDLSVQIYVDVGTGLPPEVLPEEPVTPPPCHIPHKNWATEQEAVNYFDIERWSYLMHDNPFPFQPRLLLPYKRWSTNPQEANNYFAIERWFSDVQKQGYTIPLHIPYKRWAFSDSALASGTDPHLEEDNYRYLENWSLSYRGYPGKAVPGTPPIYPNLVVQIYENVT